MDKKTWVRKICRTCTGDWPWWVVRTWRLHVEYQDSKGNTKVRKEKCWLCAWDKKEVKI